MSEGAHATPVGPVQLLVVGFDRPDFDGAALAEFERLRGGDAVRLLDVLVIHRDADGAITRLDHPDVAADGQSGALLEALIGLGAASDDAAADGPDAEPRWSLDELIPDDSAAALALVEHRWAIGARDAIRATGGSAVADAWIHPDDLATAGL